MVFKTRGRDAVAGAAACDTQQMAASLLLQLSRVMLGAALLIFVLLFDFACKLLHDVLLTIMLQHVNLSEHKCCDDNPHFVSI